MQATSGFKDALKEMGKLKSDILNEVERLLIGILVVGAILILLAGFVFVLVRIFIKRFSLN
jgi:hypothetical protein